MKLFFNSYKIPFVVTFIFVIMGIIYAFKCSPVYEVTSVSTISRKTIENPDYPLPEVRNRWVWLRDGLTLKNNLMAEQLIWRIVINNKILSKEFSLKVEFEKLSSEDHAKINDIKKNFNVDYSGPDDNIYTIKVKHQLKDIALEINKSLIVELSNLVLHKMALTYKEIILQLKQKKITAKNTSHINYITNLVHKLEASQIVERTLSKQRFKLIQSPQNSIKKVWPKIPFLILAFTILGLTTGFIFKFIFDFKSKSKIQLNL